MVLKHAQCLYGVKFNIAEELVVFPKNLFAEKGKIFNQNHKKYKRSTTPYFYSFIYPDFWIL